MNWVLDDGPLGLLGRSFNPAWQWRASTIVVVQSVAAGAAFDKSGRRQQLMAMKHGGQECIRVHALRIGSTEADIVLNYLRPNDVTATRDLGEDESIAYCMAGTSDGIFVTMDKQAAFTALAELAPDGSRRLSICGFGLRSKE